jgi:hypothetical protein
MESTKSKATRVKTGLRSMGTPPGRLCVVIQCVCFQRESGLSVSEDTASSDSSGFSIDNVENVESETWG